MSLDGIQALDMVVESDLVALDGLVIPEGPTQVAGVVQSTRGGEVHLDHSLAYFYVGLCWKTHFPPSEQLSVVEIIVIVRQHHIAK